MACFERLWLIVIMIMVHGEGCSERRVTCRTEWCKTGAQGSGGMGRQWAPSRLQNGNGPSMLSPAPAWGTPARRPAYPEYPPSSSAPSLPPGRLAWHCSAFTGCRQGLQGGQMSSADMWGALVQRCLLMPSRLWRSGCTGNASHACAAAASGDIGGSAHACAWRGALCAAAAPAPACCNASPPL